MTIHQLLKYDLKIKRERYQTMLNRHRFIFSRKRHSYILHPALNETDKYSSYVKNILTQELYCIKDTV